MTPMRSQVESGAELLARLSSKPCLRGLEDNLFFDGPRETDVIEIGGESSTGKTFLLSKILAKCILPNHYQTIPIHGCNASALLINTDHHFQISKLVGIMTSIISTAYNSSLFKTPNFIDFDEAKQFLVEDSLNKLLVVNCYNREQFLLTLHTLDDIFLEKTGIALLAIDSIAAYYWQDREMNAIGTMDTYIKKLLKLIQKHTSKFKIVTMYTRQRDTLTNYRTIDMRPAANVMDNVNYRIHLQKVNTSRDFLCMLETAQVRKKIYYSIQSHDIELKAQDEKE